MSLGYFRIERVGGRLFFLSMLTVRVVILEYRQLHKKAYNLVAFEFGMYYVPSVRTVVRMREDGFPVLRRQHNRRWQNYVV